MIRSESFDTRARGPSAAKHGSKFIKIFGYNNIEITQDAWGDR